MASKFLLKFVLPIAMLALVACAPSNNNLETANEVTDSATIVNGKPVSSKDLYARHTVAIFAENSSPCTGVIIAPHFILSAAHCELEGADIYFGLVATKKQAVYYKVKNVTPHPRYSAAANMGGAEPGDYKDYAIVEFSEDLPPGFKPVPFATLKQITKGTTIHLSGYGIDENYKYDGIMKKTQVSVVAIGEFEFMTDEKKTGSCHGDSGGPAYIMVDNKLYLAGITSRGEAQCRGYGIYGMPAAEMGWIKSVINK